MANRNWLKGAAVVLIAVLALAACSGKGSSGGGGGKASPASDFSYDLSADGQGIIITKYTGKGGKVVIPSKIEGMPVVGINGGTFAGGYMRDGTPDPNKPCNAITTIVVPSSVVNLNANDHFMSAFYQMAGLTSATLPDSLKMIPIILFAGCRKLTTVNLPNSLEKIGDAAFEGCGELNNLIIPASLQSVEFGTIVSDKWYKNGDIIPGAFGYTVTADKVFSGCGKLPIKTRQKLQELGYTGNF